LWLEIIGSGGMGVHSGMLGVGGEALLSKTKEKRLLAAGWAPPGAVGEEKAVWSLQGGGVEAIKGRRSKGGGGDATVKKKKYS